MCEAWLEEFALWNRVHNLMAQEEDPAEHVADSLSLTPYLEGANLIIDIGSGGGFPVIPLALWAKQHKPELHFIATDVVDKKIAFLKYSRAKFGLAMDVVKVDKRFFVDEPCIVISRAFADVKGALQWAGRHTSHCKGFLLMKGQKAESELALARVTNYTLIPNPRGVIVRFGFEDQGQ